MEYLCGKQSYCTYQYGDIRELCGLRELCGCWVDCQYKHVGSQKTALKSNPLPHALDRRGTNK